MGLRDKIWWWDTEVALKTLGMFLLVITLAPIFCAAIIGVLFLIVYLITNYAWIIIALIFTVVGGVGLYGVNYEEKYPSYFYKRGKLKSKEETDV